MRLILSEYIRTLKERNELDRVLPDLLVAMGIIPTAKTQTGTRQFGVDLPAVGIDPEDGIKKLFLFVIKQGDIGRNEWDIGLQSVRPSLNEIFDSYIPSHIPPSEIDLPIKIVVTTSGDMKEEFKLGWSGYTKIEKRVSFEFWGAQQLAALFETYLLNEHVFPTENRKYLRRALALAGEVDFQPDSLYQLLEIQLGLNEVNTPRKPNYLDELRKKLVLANLSTNIFTSWALEQNNSKQALIAAERSLLWTWYRIRDEFSKAKGKETKISQAWKAIWTTYYKSAVCYIEKLKPFCLYEDGVTEHLSNSCLGNIVLFEQIGMVASIGLNFLSAFAQPVLAELENSQIINEVVNILVQLIENNPSSGSPALDEQVIDINLALLFLVRAERAKEANQYLGELVNRVAFAFRSGRHFPANTLDEIVTEQYDYSTSNEDGFNYMSWLLPTLADWCVFFNRKDLYGLLEKGSQSSMKRVCQQLWHPTKEVENIFFYEPAVQKNGCSEVAIKLPKSIEEYKKRMQLILDTPETQVAEYITTNMNLEFSACRHFRTLVPPIILYTEFSKTHKSEAFEVDFRRLLQDYRDNRLPFYSAIHVWIGKPTLYFCDD